MLGRPMAADCDAEERDRLLAEAADVAAIRVNGPFSAALRSWFEQALAIDTTPFSDFQEAADAFASVTAAREDGSSALRRTLQAFRCESWPIISARLIRWRWLRSQRDVASRLLKRWPAARRSSRRELAD